MRAWILFNLAEMFYDRLLLTIDTLGRPAYTRLRQLLGT